MKRSKRVAVCLVRDSKDNVLFGLRNDNGRWTNPAGHLNRGEDPFAGARRELKEETGLDAMDLKLVHAGFKAKGSVLVYIFEAKVDENQVVDASGDPDKECNIWMYCDPNELRDNLHVAVEENWALQHWINT